MSLPPTLSRTAAAGRFLDAAEPFVTPVAVVDEAQMDRNIAAMQARAEAAGAALRPHAKTHKSLRVARRQIAAGAVGLTVATLREAEYFAAGGIDDLLLAHPPAGAVKLDRLSRLAIRVPRLAVAVDDVEIAAALPAQVEILWETDVGYGRLGTQAGAATVDAVRRLVDRIGPERFRGLLTHAGHAYAAPERERRLAIAGEEVAALVRSAEALSEDGIEVREISVGSTPTAAFAGEVRGMTELRPGTYVYGDANQVRLGTHPLGDCALAVVATIVSRPDTHRAVVDAGSKALAADSPNAAGFGIVLDHPDWTIARLSEEHGWITSESPIRPSVGDRVAIIPAHVCTTVNLHGDLLLVSAQGETAWEHIEARGWQG
ncbi:MAG TPA: alanine racemase [Chloroflexota bacterium]|nr:alanine racemase [Chloroflexota bacterium]